MVKGSVSTWSSSASGDFTCFRSRSWRIEMFQVPFSVSFSRFFNVRDMIGPRVCVTLYPVFCVVLLSGMFHTLTTCPPVRWGYVGIILSVGVTLWTVCFLRVVIHVMILHHLITEVKCRFRGWLGKAARTGDVWVTISAPVIQFPTPEVQLEKAA